MHEHAFLLGCNICLTLAGLLSRHSGPQLRFVAVSPECCCYIILPTPHHPEGTSGILAARRSSAFIIKSAFRLPELTDTLRPIALFCARIELQG